MDGILTINNTEKQQISRELEPLQININEETIINSSKAEVQKS